MKAENYPFDIHNVLSHIRGWVGSSEFVTKAARGGWVPKNAKTSVTQDVNGPFCATMNTEMDTMCLWEFACINTYMYAIT